MMEVFPAHRMVYQHGEDGKTWGSVTSQDVEVPVMSPPRHCPTTEHILAGMDDWYRDGLKEESKNNI